MIGYGMETFDDAHATFLMETRSLDHGIGHIHLILLRAHQHLELGDHEVIEDIHGFILLLNLTWSVPT